MELDQLVADREPENRHLAYMPASVDRRRVVEQLVGMANNEGGTVVVGVRTEESGTPSAIRHSECRSSLVREVEDVVAERVERPLDLAVVRFEASGKGLLGFTTPPGDRLRSYRCDCMEKPVFPVRRQTEVTYLSGLDVSWYA